IRIGKMYLLRRKEEKPMEHDAKPSRENPDDADRTELLHVPPDSESATQPITQPVTLTDSSRTMATVIAEERRSVLAMLQSSQVDARATATFFTDKYQIVGELGKGGVGQVLKVMDRDLKREVAMKMLLAGPSGEPN